MSSDFEEQFAKSTGELTEDLAADLLAPRLLVIENAVGSGQHDDSKRGCGTGFLQQSQISLITFMVLRETKRYWSCAVGERA